jgi:hypothetical protein
VIRTADEARARKILSRFFGMAGGKEEKGQSVVGPWHDPDLSSCRLFKDHPEPDGAEELLEPQEYREEWEKFKPTIQRYPDLKA